MITKDNTNSPSSTKWNIISISCGRDHTLAVLDDGRVFGWGGSGSGRLPSSLPQYCTTPAKRRGAVEVRSTAKMTDVTAGYGISLGITEQGAIQIWGDSISGVAGQLNTINSVTPQLLGRLSSELIQTAAANEFQFGAVDKEGKVYTWGLNTEGALGRPAIQFNDAPGLITGLPPIQQLAIGRAYMLAIDKEGVIYAWGSNSAGQLGLGHLSSTPTPIAHTSSKVRYQMVAAGTSHCLGLTDQGCIYAWGSNHRGQLGFAEPAYATQPVLVKLPEPMKAITAGMHFSVAIGRSGQVYAWGWNGHGQLGVGDTIDRSAPTQVNYLKKVSAISAGETHVVALTSDGLFGWGGNMKSQLGELERQQKFAALFF